MRTPESRHCCSSAKQRLVTSRRRHAALRGEGLRSVMLMALAAAVTTAALRLAFLLPEAKPPPREARRRWLLSAGLASASSLVATPCDARVLTSKDLGQVAMVDDPTSTVKVREDGTELQSYARPLKRGPKLYSVDIPVPANKAWEDFSKSGREWNIMLGKSSTEVDIVLKGKFGEKSKDPQTVVLAGKPPPGFVESIHGNYTTPGTGIISEVRTGNQLDLEWIDTDSYRPKKSNKNHNFARIIFDPKIVNVNKSKDVLLCMSIPQQQFDDLKWMWPIMRDSLKYKPNAE
eukprot:TRINITY_DN7074_c0_g1_i1.p1 TRINITY_DN7074_c0_g1~~TRINITY_DN7074_c0_g1_i1.p1  ORF type:complete len:298 (-),score=61.89 TRINITY_DN7074_c0_g1_i1:66-935(-)